MSKQIESTDAEASFIESLEVANADPIKDVITTQDGSTIEIEIKGSPKTEDVLSILHETALK